MKIVKNIQNFLSAIFVMSMVVLSLVLNAAGLLRLSDGSLPNLGRFIVFIY